MTPEEIQAGAAEFLDEGGRWSCTKCGACCRLLNVMPEMAPLDRGDGTCIHLTEDNRCGVYEDRPQLCRVPPGAAESAVASQMMAYACSVTKALAGVEGVEKSVSTHPGWENRYADLDETGRWLPKQLLGDE